jgi:hypothetical protein
MVKFRFYSLTIGLVLALSSSAFASPITSFFFNSSPSSWVGGGGALEITPDDNFVFSASRNFDQGVSFSINDFGINPDFWSTRWWYLDFASADGSPLQVGSYENATRFPFQAPGVAGLTFAGNGRGDNTSTGSFEVLQADYAADGSVLAFAANFTQYDEGIKEWWNVGGIRYNATVSTSVPEPSSLVILMMGLAGLVFARRKALR